MKKIRYLLSSLLIFLLIFNIASCKVTNEENGQEQEVLSAPTASGTEQQEEKDVLVVSKTMPSYTEEELLQNAALILRGRVLQLNSETLTNPDGTLLNEDGSTVFNQMVLDYTVAIDEIYKGSYTGTTIHVKTSYGDGLNSDLILYGEDEHAVLGSDLGRMDLSTEGDCILLLNYVDTGREVSTGYFLTGESSYLIPDSNGNYSSANGLVNPLTVSPNTLAAEIAAATE